MVSLIPKNIFWQRYKQLNPKLINYPFSENFSLALDEACNLGKIIDPQMRDTLADLVKAVLYIVIPKENLKQEIIKKLGISSAYAEIINQVIQKRIFEPLKNDLEQYKSLLPTQTVETIEPKVTHKIEETQPKQEETKPKKIEELLQTTRPIEEKPKEEIKKSSVPDLNLPEVPEIKIERPVNKTGELKRVTAPEVTPEEQEKIHSRLLEAIQKKETKPKILEQIKKVLETGVKTQPETKSSEKPVAPAEAPSASKVVGGNNNEKFKTEPKSPASSQKPYIFNVKLKKEEEKKESLPKGEIKYQKTTEKPFGEA